MIGARRAGSWSNSAAATRVMARVLIAPTRASQAKGSSPAPGRIDLDHERAGEGRLVGEQVEVADQQLLESDERWAIRRAEAILDGRREHLDAEVVGGKEAALGVLELLVEGVF